MARSLTILAGVVFLVSAGSLAHAGTDPAVACTSTKAKAAGKKAAGLLKAFGKNLKKSDPAKLGQSVSKAQSKFTKAFSKAEAKGGCGTSGDSGTIEAKVDAFVSDSVSEVDPPSTTTTTSGATTTTTGGGTTTTSGGATTTTTGGATTTTTSTTTTTIMTGQPPCGGATAPLCDGHCPPGMMCVDFGGFCDCAPTGGPCGAVSPAPLCYGDCPPLMACVDMGGICMCMP